MPRRVMFALLFALGCGSPFIPPEAEGCIDQVGEGSHDYTCDGLRYRVSVPKRCSTEPCGLIADIHGFSMNAAMEEANTSLAARGRERGYLVIQPSANPEPPFSSWTPFPENAEKVFAFIALAARVWRVDPARVHVTGFSMGGVMSWQILCRHADVIASAAPAAGAGCAFEGDEVPSRPVDVLYLHGTEDEVVGFAENAIPQIARARKAWQMDPGTVIAGDGSFTRRRYVGAEGTVLEFLTHGYRAAPCTVTLGGHCFPGSTDPGREPAQICPFGCVGPNAFDWGAEVIAFFEAHPHP